MGFCTFCLDKITLDNGNGRCCLIWIPVVYPLIVYAFTKDLNDKPYLFAEEENCLCNIFGFSRVKSRWFSVCRDTTTGIAYAEFVA